MPAAAVIPAPIVYTNVVAVKKLVVGNELGYRHFKKEFFFFFKDFDNQIKIHYILKKRDFF